MAIHPSPYLAVLLLISHLAAALAAYASDTMPAWLFLAIMLPLSASLSYHLARDALLSLPVSWRRLSIEDGVATVVTRGGSELVGQVVDGSVVTPWFVILRIEPEGGRWPITRAIFPDALEDDAFRELCVRLRYA